MTAFETKPCGRCGGSGSYSWNAMHGSTCYGCGGSGRVFTKRGRAASEFFRSLLMVPAGELKVGDRYFMAGFSAGSYTEPNRWVRIDEITTDESGKLSFKGTDVKRGESCGFSGVPVDLPMRKSYTAEEKAPWLKQALEYQATLDANGKPSKKAAVAA